MLGFFLETPLDDPAQRRRQLRGQRLGFAQHGHQSLDARVALERALAGRELVEHEPERELIGACVDLGRALHLLGAHVGRRARDEPRGRDRRRRGAGLRLDAATITVEPCGADQGVKLA